mmetsp:Transcript_50122/g.121440  ORF Transcript_50122/g.121440 Transcript_50122/m.121440 type:complete len:469 (-) Transcript_50122:124-1530(-)
MTSHRQPTMSTTTTTTTTRLLPPRGVSNNEYSIGRTQLKMYRQQSSFRGDEWRPWLRLGWRLHFATTTLMVIWACTYNLGGRKYVPIQINNNNSGHNSEKMATQLLQTASSSSSSGSGGDLYDSISSLSDKCHKAFVNVFAESIDEPGAVVYCCQDKSKAKSSSDSFYLPSDSPVGAGICQPPHRTLGLSQRLSRFPEAWLIPLFPIILRFFVIFAMGFCSRYKQQQHHHHHLRHNHNHNQNRITSPLTDTCTAACSTTTTTQTPTMTFQQRLLRRRFYLYLFLIQIRGWVLYLLLDKLEDHLMLSSSSSSSSDIGGDEGRQCWYQPLLSKNYESCHGRTPDFSDHMVLYCAQILPLALTETLYAFAVPYWSSSTKNNTGGGGGPASSSSKNVFGVVIPTMLVGGMMYLYALVFSGIIKTATYFHTWPEVVCGYFISMVIQIPLFLMQTTDTRFLERPREYFFGVAMS